MEYDIYFTFILFFLLIFSLNTEKHFFWFSRALLSMCTEIYRNGDINLLIVHGCICGLCKFPLQFQCRTVAIFSAFDRSHFAIWEINKRIHNHMIRFEKSPTLTISPITVFNTHSLVLLILLNTFYFREEKCWMDLFCWFFASASSNDFYTHRKKIITP